MGTNTLKLTDASFGEVAAQGVTLVDFRSERCPPCRAQGPIVDKVAESFADRVKVGKLDVDSNPKVVNELGLMYIPTLIVLKDGKEVKRFTGLQQEEVLASALERALAGSDVIEPGDLRYCRLTHRIASEPAVSGHLAEVERKEIARALRQFNGHRGRAAEYLGINRKTLRNKIRKYRIEDAT